ncbi:hypothetical protein WJX77_006330 [Trebouxia sp. C0004]
MQSHVKLQQDAGLCVVLWHKAPALAREQLRKKVRKQLQQLLSTGIPSVKIEEPETFEEAMQSFDAEQWSLAMNEEIASLQANGIWVLVEEPQGVKSIPGKWTFKKEAGCSRQH